MDINCELIKNYIKHISSETDCHIIINDNLHILKNMSEFKDVPEISRWHTNEYCMKIKENIKLSGRSVQLAQGNGVDALPQQGKHAGAVGVDSEFPVRVQDFSNQAVIFGNMDGIKQGRPPLSAWQGSLPHRLWFLPRLRDTFPAAQPPGLPR